MSKIVEGIFPHMCEEEDCGFIVIFDDEPKCFTHSPDEGSSVKGYSALRKAKESAKLPTTMTFTIKTWLTPMQMKQLHQKLKDDIVMAARRAGAPVHEYTDEVSQRNFYG